MLILLLDEDTIVVDDDDDDEDWENYISTIYFTRQRTHYKILHGLQKKFLQYHVMSF